MKYGIRLVKYPTLLLLLLLALGACNGGGDGSIDDEFIAFSPIPECVAECFLNNPTGYDSTGQESKFVMDLRRVEPDGNIDSIIDNQIEWDILGCSSIIFTGDVSE